MTFRTPDHPDGFVQSPKIFFGESFSFVFEAPGDYTYYCSTHKKKMNGARVAVR
mgnify:CR=1 FL=1